MNFSFHITKLYFKIIKLNPKNNLSQPSWMHFTDFAVTTRITAGRKKDCIRDGVNATRYRKVRWQAITQKAVWLGCGFMET